MVEKRESWKSSWGFGERLKAPATSLKLAHLTEGTEYYARVKAENKAGLSEPLESDKFIPKSPYGELNLKISINQRHILSSNLIMHFL